MQPPDFQVGASVSSLIGGRQQAGQGILLLAESLCLLVDGLGGAIEFLNGVLDLLVTESLNRRQISRFRQELGFAIALY